MQIIRTDNGKNLGIAAAARVADLVARKPNATLVFPTGDTPLPMYRELVDLYQRNPADVFHISLKDVTIFNLDEYVNVPQEYSYRQYMWDNLLKYTGFSNFHIPFLPWYLKVHGDRTQATCNEYNRLLDQHPIDLAVLGVGQNGHIGFNEPGCDPEARTHLVTLSESTRAANAHLFRSPEDVPTQAITMGLKDILSAKRIILLASGSAKKEAILRLSSGKEDPDWPVTYLLRHSDVTLIVDNDCFPY